MVLHNNKIVVLSDWPINVTLFRDVTIGQLVCVCDLHSTTLLIYIRNIHTNEAFNHLPICIGIYFSTHYTHTHTQTNCFHSASQCFPFVSFSILYSDSFTNYPRWLLFCFVVFSDLHDEYICILIVQSNRLSAFFLCMFVH